jgi:hypothetical protein
MSVASELLFSVLFNLHCSRVTLSDAPPLHPLRNNKLFEILDATSFLLRRACGLAAQKLNTGFIFVTCSALLLAKHSCRGKSRLTAPPRLAAKQRRLPALIKPLSVRHFPPAGQKFYGDI